MKRLPGLSLAAMLAAAMLTPGPGHIFVYLFQILPLGAALREIRGHLRPRLVEAYNECQYRVWFDGDTFTFNEDDEGWLAKVLPGGELGPTVEQPLMRTTTRTTSIQSLVKPCTSTAPS